LEARAPQNNCASHGTICGQFNSGSNTLTRWMADLYENQLHLLSKVSLSSCRVEV
jgi:hypothetical protein